MTTLPTQRSLTLTLDFANELVQFRPTEHFTLTLAKSLHDDPAGDDLASGQAIAADGELDDSGKRVAKREMWRGGDEGLAADYEYVMYGKVSLRQLYCKVVSINSDSSFGAMPLMFALDIQL